MVSSAKIRFQKSASQGDEIVGMESFFITILPKDMDFSFSDGLRSVYGNSDILELDWETILKSNNFSVSKNETHFILDNCLEMDIEKSNSGSSSIILRGCFSCFDECIRKMKNLVTLISNLTDKKIKIDILGKFVKLEKDSLDDVINNLYEDKRNNFIHNFGNIKLHVPPSRFYKEDEKSKNPLKKLVSQIFKK